jgi:uncharacterized repeat protein (TIGR03803 family)
MLPIACCLAISVSVPLHAGHAGTGFTVMHTFTGGDDGAFPEATLLVDSGKIYGTAESGGRSNKGVVFQMTRKGAETVLYNFTGGSDGANPETDLVADKDGNLYGRTVAGGAYGYGTIFRTAPDGTETTLLSFTELDNGNAGLTGLIRDGKGNLYGADDQSIFRLAPDGTETILYTFSGSDGENPNGDLLRDKSGDLYGTTHNGGTDGKGVVFEIAAGGKESTLYNFQGGNDGYAPDSGPTVDAAGNFYGTTYTAGSADCGIVYKLAPDGTETVFHAFAGGSSDGCNPQFGRLAIDDSGDLYGMTNLGPGTACGGHGCGIVFKIAPDGNEKIRHAFTGTDGYWDGYWPNASVVADHKGWLWGATWTGGTDNYGVVFKVKSRFASARGGLESIPVCRPVAEVATPGFTCSPGSRKPACAWCANARRTSRPILSMAAFFPVGWGSRPWKYAGNAAASAVSSGAAVF